MICYCVEGRLSGGKGRSKATWRRLLQGGVQVRGDGARARLPGGEAEKR